LGLWEKPKEEVVKMHFAFRCDEEDILNKSIDYLRARKIKPYNFLNDKREIPLVFAWMPALAIYFDDPDGHCLEFISIIDGEPNGELGIITYEEWNKYLEEKKDS